MVRNIYYERNLKLDRNLKKIGFIFLLVLAVFGWNGIHALVSTVQCIFAGFAPLILAGIKNRMEEFFTSPGFIASAITFVLSLWGIYVSVRGERIICSIISVLITLWSAIEFCACLS